ncbi:CarboxypepD_reg-like domain-containing protein [Pricia antarctica]|uniref:CarboxypepD_reg-like domain-containing protein n=1 Tax=Pricia antarctica TaxID=641691 RepID=A0A1G6ZQ11_9FLAO|nr:carboxypeptidase-like regulatory domain-containing protein [Pricia antarctica]SDE04864.1 CarboxypepD_reg-like domain-containing protein [Pricia antarctica]
MPIQHILIPCCLIMAASAQGQDFFSEKMEGRVYSDDGDVAATHVLNTTTDRATITDSDGFFAISVHLNDTLVFSAVQYKRKEIVVTLNLLESKLVLIPLEEALTELDEVVVTPYNLSGDIARDLSNLDIEPVVTTSTLGLPNAYVKPISKAERELYAATANPIMSLDPLINTITGRKKLLKKRVERNKIYARTERVRDFYVDSLYTTKLKIPKEKIDDFLYFCEVDPDFQSLVDTHDRLAIWEFMRKKSWVYLEGTKQ